MRRLLKAVFTLLLMLPCSPLQAWDATGHAIVAMLAERAQAKGLQLRLELGPGLPVQVMPQ